MPAPGNLKHRQALVRVEARTLTHSLTHSLTSNPLCVFSLLGGFLVCAGNPNPFFSFLFWGVGACIYKAGTISVVMATKNNASLGESGEPISKHSFILSPLSFHSCCGGKRWDLCGYAVFALLGTFKDQP